MISNSLSVNFADFFPYEIVLSFLSKLYFPISILDWNKNLNFKNFFLIAEAGINHNGSLRKAFKLVDAAKKSGASAIKFQTYKTEKRVKKNNPVFNVLKRCELSFEQFKKLKKYCDRKKIIFFSTPFDIESVDFLDQINVKLFKKLWKLYWFS